MLGLDADSVRTVVAAQMASMGGRGGPPAGGDAPAGGLTQTSRGDVALDARQGGGPGGQGMQMPDVTDAQCAAVTAALAKKPAEAAKLEALRQQMMNGQLDRDAMREQTQAIYAAVGVDARVAGACRRRASQAGAGGAGAPAGAATGAAAGASTGQRRGPAGQAGGTGAGAQVGGRGDVAGAGFQGGGQARGRRRPGLVFVKKGETFEPRLVMLGASNFDYTEVVTGVTEGEQVAMLAAASLQAERQQNQDRIRERTGLPGMNQQPAAGGAGGARAGGATGGARGGGGGGGGRGGQ
jgi:hypothetical protein